MNIYLASPYSSNQSAIREVRAQQASIAAGALLQKGFLVYSPIASWHHVAIMLNLRFDFSYFRELDLSFIRRWSDELWVLGIDKWDSSTGVKAEMQVAWSSSQTVRLATLEEILCLPIASDDLPLKALPNQLRNPL